MRIRRLATLALLGLAGCQTFGDLASPESTLNSSAYLKAQVILIGEQHDAPEQGEVQAQIVKTLINEGRLLGLVLEMAEAGTSTVGLDSQASDEAVKHALHWAEAAWPWSRYSGAIMHAVAAGVSVYGGNLPRSEMPAKMLAPSAFEHQHPMAWQRLQALVTQGHCDLLPKAQIPAMTRIQVAKDQRMAQTIADLSHEASPGQAVVLIAGAVHVNRKLGVPLHLLDSMPTWSLELRPRDAQPSPTGDFDATWLTPKAPSTDHCGQLRERWATRP